MQMITRWVALALLGVAPGYGCIVPIQPEVAEYTPPEVPAGDEQYQRVVEKGFDETWEALVQSTARMFFGIENFEKDSGLLTLSFGVETPEEYVDGGVWSWTFTHPSSWQKTQFDGAYVDYLTLYGEGSLSGRMNIVVSPISENRTRVVVNTRYTFTAVVKNAATGGVSRVTWSFESGGSDTIHVQNPIRGTPFTRTMAPTYRAEAAIIEAIEQL